MSELLSFPTTRPGPAVAERSGQPSVDRYRQQNPAADRWAAGYGLIRHAPATQARVFALAKRLASEQGPAIVVPFFDVLHAADRVASADTWLLVHLIYARTMHLDGRDVVARDFDPHPDERVATTLNLVPARVGYLAAKTIAGQLRGWVEVDAATKEHLPGLGTVLVHLRSAEDQLLAYLDGGDQAVDSVVFDGRDPAAFAWAICEIEAGLPDAVGVAPVGAGFYPEAVGVAPPMLLGNNPRASAAAVCFNERARQAWVPLAELRQALTTLNGQAEVPRPTVPSALGI